MSETGHYHSAINLSSPQMSIILDTVVTLGLTSLNPLHPKCVFIPNSQIHPPAKCPKTAANLKAELIISDSVTDALRLASNRKSLSVPGTTLVFYSADFTTTMQCYLVGGLLATCLGKPLWLSLVFWLPQPAVPLAGLSFLFLRLNHSLICHSPSRHTGEKEIHLRKIFLPFLSL